MPVAATGDESTASTTITQSDIDQFAGLVGDDNPLHVDPEYAADGPFGGPVAHGMLTGGVVSAAVAGLPGDIVYVSQELSFERPVSPGDELTATALVTEQLDGDRLAVETTAETDAVVLTGSAEVLSVSR